MGLGKHTLSFIQDVYLYRSLPSPAYEYLFIRVDVVMGKRLEFQVYL